MIIINYKNYLVWAVVALVVILGGYFLLQGNSKQAEVAKNLPEATATATTVPTAVVVTIAEATTKNIVDYTDKGFLPKSITIKVGESVTWINNSTKSMWVASAVHPTHNELPGFDELTSVPKGGKYTFTFTKAGNWKYHNHLSASDTAAVVVK